MALSGNAVSKVRSVAIIVPELLPVPPVKGGAIEHWVHEVSARIGHDYSIAVVSRPAGAPGLTGVRYIGIAWTQTELWFHNFKERASRSNPLRQIAKIQNVWSYGVRVARAVVGFDIIYLHNEPNLLLFLRGNGRQKVVLHMHNDHLSISLFRPMYRRALAKADLVLCVSEHIRRRAIGHFPEHAFRFKVVPNGTDASIFKPYGEAASTILSDKILLDSAYMHLLYVGRLTHIKGVHVLINAFQTVLQQHPQTRLVVTGSSFFEGAARTPYEEELKRLAQPISSSVIFTGFLAHTTLKYLYSAADIVVVPSIWEEPSGLVVLEAMASGGCVVATSVGGIPELVQHQHTGLLVPPGDVAALCNAICSLLSEPSSRARLGEAARAKVVAEFTWERLVAQIENAFGELQ